MKKSGIFIFILVNLLTIVITVTAVIGILQYKENKNKNADNGNYNNSDIQYKIGGSNSSDEQNAGQKYQIDENAGDYVAPETKSDPGIAIPGWPSLNIPPNETEITVDFYNPIENEGYYYLTFELRLLDDSEQGYEVLYTSGLVEPNKHIQMIKLSHGLEKGTYDAIIFVQPVTMDGKYIETNNLEMALTLNVE